MNDTVSHASDKNYSTMEGTGISLAPQLQTICSLFLIILVPVFVILLQFVTARIRNDGSRPNQTSNQLLNNGRRRIQHALTGLLFYILSFILPFSIACLLLSSTTTLFYILHLSRSRWKSVQRYYIQQFGPLLREHEKNVHSIPGAFWFLLGTTILLLSTSMDITRTSLLCLSFGDPMASTVGMALGGPKFQFQYGKKSLAGCSACFITCVSMSIFCMGSRYGQGIWFLTGLVATLMEVSSGLIAIDDNILIPLGTGAALSLYLRFYDLMEYQS